MSTRTSLRPRILFLALLVGIGFVVPHAADTKNQENRGTAKIRLIHDFATAAVPQPAKVDVRLGRESAPDANPVKASLAYGEVSKYLRLKPAGLRAGVYPNGGNALLSDTPLHVTGRDRVTVLLRQAAVGDDTLVLQVLSDNDRKPKKRKNSVRFVHVIADAAADGVRVGTVADGCLTAALSFGAETTQNLDKGSHTFAVFAPGDADCSGTPLFTAEATDFRARTAYTVLARATKNGSPEPFELIVLRDF